MNTPNDTIVAPATAAGGAIAVVRMSGPSALAICDTVFSGARRAGEAAGYTVLYGTIADGARVLDDVLVTVFRGRFAERFIQKGIGFDVIDRAAVLNINDGTEVHRIYDGEQKKETQQRKRAQRGAGTHNIAPACLELFGAGNMNQIKRQCRKKNNNHDIRRKQNKFRHHFKRILGSAIV